MSQFYCPACKVQLNSKSQWDQHIIGGKHLRATNLHQPESSAAISLPDGKYGCKFCEDFTCSGLVPMEQHLIGQKHMKNVQRSKEQSPIKLLSTSVSLLSTTSLNKNFDDTSSLSSDMTTYGVLQSDGITYKCKACDDFFCSGPIPMQAHLKGKNHQKNVKKSLQFGVFAGSPEQVNVSAQPPARRIKSKSTPTPVEKRVENAWKHETMCGYEYSDSFPQLSLSDKIEALNPHFAFISKDEPIPNLVKYLSM